MLTLLWLTVSLPVVSSAKQAWKQSIAQDNDNPFQSTTEEKAPSTVNISEEYIHHHQDSEHPWYEIKKEYPRVSIAAYIAYHGELFSPPPNC